MKMYLTQGLHRAVQQNPHAIATVFLDRRRTYAQLADRVARLAGALCRLGLKPGERVGILALSSDRYLEYYLAVWWAGGVVNPVNIRWSATEIAYSLDDCDTRTLFIDDTFLGMLDDLRGQSRSLATVIYMGDRETPLGTSSYEELISSSKPVEDMYRCGDDLAGVFYTGGTTGKPKGVMLSQTNLVFNVLIQLLDAPFDDRAVLLQNLPLFHLAGLSFLLRGLVRGCRQVILPSFTPLEVIRSIADERATHLVMVPTMLQMLVDDPRVKDQDLSSVVFVGYGASPINEAVLERAFKVFPAAGFVQGYGMTETAAGITYLQARYHTPEGRLLGKLRSAGQALTGVDVKIVDHEGREVPRGTVGEIIARSPSLMSGYWNRPEETANALRDGWMYSGDAGYMDVQGFVFLVDRLKDMIVTGGENVYSSEVENALAQHPAIALVAVIGVPSDQWGESVHAVVVLKSGNQASAEEIQLHCKSLIAGYKCPRSVEFRESLPISGAGKLLKRELREPYWVGRTRQVG